MVQLDQEILGQFAAKYIWWKTPSEALQHPDRVIAQVMDIGDYDNVQKLVAQIGDEYLQRVLIRAEIGQFSERLGLAVPGKVPSNDATRTTPSSVASGSPTRPKPIAPMKDSLTRSA